MTPREFAIYARAYSEKMTFEQERRQREIYLSALLTSSFVWAKHRPTYEKIFGGTAKRREMTDEEMLHRVEALNAQLGGTDSRKKVK